MGACYSVTCSLKFKKDDTQKVLQKMQERYQKDLDERVGFCIEKYPFKEPSTIEDYIDLYFVEHQNMYSFNVQDCPYGVIKYEVTSYFDASYGWEMVMLQFFECIAELLIRGSVLDMYPENDHVIYRVKNGKVY